MFSKQYKNVLFFNPGKDASSSKEADRQQKIRFRKFEKSTRTMQMIKDAGLENEIDDYIEVEGNFKIKKIGKYTLFIFTQYFMHLQLGMEQHQWFTKPTKQVTQTTSSIQRARRESATRMPTPNSKQWLSRRLRTCSKVTPTPIAP